MAVVVMPSVSLTLPIATTTLRSPINTPSPLIQGAWYSLRISRWRRTSGSENASITGRIKLADTVGQADQWWEAAGIAMPFSLQQLGTVFQVTDASARIWIEIQRTASTTQEIFSVDTVLEQLG